MYTLYYLVCIHTHRQLLGIKLYFFLRTDTHTVTSCAGVRLRRRHLALDLSLNTRIYTQLTHSTHADMHTDICCLTVISRTVSVESYISLPPPQRTQPRPTHTRTHTLEWCQRKLTGG